MFLSVYLFIVYDKPFSLNRVPQFPNFLFLITRDCRPAAMAMIFCITIITFYFVYSGINFSISLSFLLWFPKKLSRVWSLLKSFVGNEFCFALLILKSRISIYLRSKSFRSYHIIYKNTNFFSFSKFSEEGGKLKRW